MKKLMFVLLLLSIAFEGYSPKLAKNIEQYKQKMHVLSQEIRVRSLQFAFLMAESKGNYHAPGLSGEYGAYQFLPDTWRMYCKKLVGKVLDIRVPANQDLIARKKIERLISAGYTDKQIAAIWNCGASKYENKIGINKYGVKYNVPAYVAKIIKFTNTFKAKEYATI